MDQQLLFIINREYTHPVLDWAMVILSSFDMWWPIFLAALIAMVVWGNFRLRAMLLAIGLAVGVTDALVVDTLKTEIGRPRPHDAVPGVRTLDLAKAKPRLLALGQPLQQQVSPESIQGAGGNSFPSGHAANNFAVAAVCFAFFPRRGWFVFIVATLVAYSRVYVGAHWPLDVTVSAFIGAGLGFLTVAVMELVWRRWGARCLPRLREAQPSLLRA